MTKVVDMKRGFGKEKSAPSVGVQALLDLRDRLRGRIKSKQVDLNSLRRSVESAEEELRQKRDDLASVEEALKTLGHTDDTADNG